MYVQHPHLIPSSSPDPIGKCQRLCLRWSPPFHSNSTNYRRHNYRSTPSRSLPIWNNTNYRSKRDTTTSERHFHDPTMLLKTHLVSCGQHRARKNERFHFFYPQNRENPFYVHGPIILCSKGCCLAQFSRRTWHCLLTRSSPSKTGVCCLPSFLIGCLISSKRPGEVPVSIIIYFTSVLDLRFNLSNPNVLDFPSNRKKLWRHNGDTPFQLSFKNDFIPSSVSLFVFFSSSFIRWCVSNILNGVCPDVLHGTMQQLNTTVEYFGVFTSPIDPASLSLGPVSRFHAPLMFCSSSIHSLTNTFLLDPSLFSSSSPCLMFAPSLLFLVCSIVPFLYSSDHFVPFHKSLTHLKSLFESVYRQ